MNSSFSLGVCLTIPLLFMACSKELMISNPKRPTISPSQLAVHGDSINFSINSSVLPSTLSQNAIYKLTPKFTYDEDEIVLEPLEFRGSKKSQSLEKRYSIPYSSGMEDGRVEVFGDFVDTKSGEKVAYRLPLLSSHGVVTTSQLLEEVYTAAYSSQPTYFNKRDTLRLDYIFSIGSHEIVSNAINNALNKRLDSLISSDNIILGSRVIGTHSPVGSDETNRVLSQKRAAEVKKIYDVKIVNHPSTDLDRLGIELDVEFNSWSIFIEKLKTTNLWERDREAISEITSNSYDYETVKSKLLALPDIGAISREVFPKLQMSRMEIAYGRTFDSRQELNDTIDRIISEPTLSHHTLTDILDIAQLETNGRRRIEIYESAAQKGSSWQLYNDWAATYLDSYRLWNSDLGNQHLLNVNDLLKQSLDLEVSPEANINIGIVYSIAGQYDLAFKYFDQAKVSITSVDSRLGNPYSESRGIAEVKAGHYVEAVALLNNSTDSRTYIAHNNGLANLLAGKQQNALPLFDKALKNGADSAHTLYIQAIAANRLNNRNLTTKYLAKAFEINPRYNDFFHQDHEFDNINKVLFPRYADSLKRPVRRFKKQTNYRLPDN